MTQKRKHKMYIVVYKRDYHSATDPMTYESAKTLAGWLNRKYAPHQYFVEEAQRQEG